MEKKLIEKLPQQRNQWRRVLVPLETGEVDVDRLTAIARAFRVSDLYPGDWTPSNTPGRLRMLKLLGLADTRPRWPSTIYNNYFSRKNRDILNKVLEVAGRSERIVNEKGRDVPLLESEPESDSRVIKRKITFPDGETKELDYTFWVVTRYSMMIFDPSKTRIFFDPVVLEQIYDTDLIARIDDVSITAYPENNRELKSPVCLACHRLFDEPVESISEVLPNFEPSGPDWKNGKFRRRNDGDLVKVKGGTSYVNRSNMSICMTCYNRLKRKGKYEAGVLSGDVRLVQYDKRVNAMMGRPNKATGEPVDQSYVPRMQTLPDGFTSRVRMMMHVSANPDEKGPDPLLREFARSHKQTVLEDGTAYYLIKGELRELRQSKYWVTINMRRYVHALEDLRNYVQAFKSALESLFTDKVFCQMIAWRRTTEFEKDTYSDHVRLIRVYGGLEVGKVQKYLHVHLLCTIDHLSNIQVAWHKCAEYVKGRINEWWKGHRAKLLEYVDREINELRDRPELLEQEKAFREAIQSRGEYVQGVPTVQFSLLPEDRYLEKLHAYIVKDLNQNERRSALRRFEQMRGMQVVSENLFVERAPGPVREERVTFPQQHVEPMEYHELIG